MEFPRFVFTSPGPHVCNGGTYGYEIVEDSGEYDAAIKAGFFDTVPDAISGNKTESVTTLTSEDDSKDSELDDLVKKAESLGIKVDKRWKQARLEEEIAKAEEAKDAVRE